MIVEIESRFKRVTPSDGMWLYNETNGIITDGLIMPLSAPESEWVEITDEEKERIEEAIEEE